MRTLFDAKRDLLRDDAFKRRFLSAKLRQRIELALKQCDKWPAQTDPSGGHPAAPDQWNKTIFNAWDIPTSYTVSLGHQTSDRAVYDVIYYWGTGTQYEGTQRITSVILTRENERWYIDDLYTHNGGYCSAFSLYESLVRNR